MPLPNKNHNLLISPAISIGLPIYNGGKQLPSVLNSILHQTFTEFEIIIGDNASTDHTPNICREFAEKDVRIRYFRHKNNCGALANFNFVLEQSNGEYFVWMAADDVWDKKFLEILYASLKEDPKGVCAFCPYQYIDEEDNPVGMVRSFNYSHHLNFFQLIKFCFYYDDVFIYSLFKSAVIKKIKFMPWRGMNAKNLLNTSHPILYFILASGKYIHCGNTPLMSKRLRSSGGFHHYAYKNFWPIFLLGYFFWRINVFSRSLGTVYRGSNSFLFTLLIFPFLFLRLISNLLTPSINPLRKRRIIKRIQDIFRKRAF